MPWFVAHVVLKVELKEPAPDTTVSCWENLYLIQADSHEEAHDKALSVAQDATGDSSGSFRWAGRPARWVLAGVRKTMKCTDSANQPTDGTELTYNELLFANEDDLRAYLEGRPIALTVED